MLRAIDKMESDHLLAGAISHFLDGDVYNHGSITNEAEDLQIPLPCSFQSTDQSVDRDLEHPAPLSGGRALPGWSDFGVKIHDRIDQGNMRQSLRKVSRKTPSVAVVFLR